MSDYDEAPSVYSGTYDVEVLIDRPMSEVWKQFLQLSSWVTSHRIEEVSGAPGTVGSITRVFDENATEPDYPPPHYHFCKVIKLIPEQRYVLKTYSEKGGSYGLRLACFDDFQFVAIDGKTKITFNLFAEFEGEAIARDPSIGGMDGSREGMAKNLNNLKRIVERN